MAKAVRFHRTGGQEVLQVEDVQLENRARPGEDPSCAIGVNFVDTHSGRAVSTLLPAIAGNEGAGVVEAVGPGVTDIKGGDRVATPVPGAHLRRAVAPADRWSSCRRHHGGAGGFDVLKGLTVHYLIFTTYPVKRRNGPLAAAAAALA